MSIDREFIEYRDMIENNYHEAKNNTNNKINQICPVCFEYMNIINRCSEKCGHYFHAQCVKGNTNNPICCPICAEMANVPLITEEGVIDPETYARITLLQIEYPYNMENNDVLLFSQIDYLNSDMMFPIGCSTDSQIKNMD